MTQARIFNGSVDAKMKVVEEQNSARILKQHPTSFSLTTECKQCLFIERPGYHYLSSKLALPVMDLGSLCTSCRRGGGGRGGGSLGKCSRM